MRIACFLVIAGLLFTGGCTSFAGTGQQPERTPASSNKAYTDIYRHPLEVVRSGRYTLVDIRSTDAQREPLHIVIKTTLPSSLVNTLGDGFRYLLFDSGYSLCTQYTNDPEFTAMLARKLPAVQRRIGSVRLYEALQLLAGSAWRMQVNEVNREVCFVLREGYGTLAKTIKNTDSVVAAPASSS